jgi:hypothetical protein
MKKLILYIIIFPSFILAQEKSKLIFGINAGTYLANKNTASLYAGNVTSYGVSSILNNINFRPSFEQFFQYPFEISSFPSNIKYNLGTEIGIHIGKEKERSKIYVDINFAEIKVQDVVVLEVDNPNNQSTEPDYVPISLIGKEKRNMINIGVQKNIFKESKFSLSIPIFFQLIQVELKQNYVVINQQPYNINHSTINNSNQNQNPQGYGIGFGSELSRLQFDWQIPHYFVGQYICLIF